MNTLAKSTGLDWYVDDVLQTTGSKLINAGSHKIRVKNTTESQKPVFYKMAFPNTVTDSTRKVITLPSNMIITSAN